MTTAGSISYGGSARIWSLWFAGHEFKLLQVKEKFGGLRFYVRFDGLRLSHADDAIR